jgi:hypothetical protein
MSTYQQRLTAAPERLSVLVHDIASLNLQLGELHGLRDRVRRAELSPRKSRPTGNRKIKRRDEIQGKLPFEE